MIASLLFLLFGLWILLDNALGLPTVAIVVTATVGGLAVATALVRWALRRKAAEQAPNGP